MNKFEKNAGAGLYRSISPAQDVAKIIFTCLTTFLSGETRLLVHCIAVVSDCPHIASSADLKSISMLWLSVELLFKKKNLSEHLFSKYYASHWDWCELLLSLYTKKIKTFYPSCWWKLSCPITIIWYQTPVLTCWHS